MPSLLLLNTVERRSTFRSEVMLPSASACLAWELRGVDRVGIASRRRTGRRETQYLKDNIFADYLFENTDLRQAYGLRDAYLLYPLKLVCLIRKYPLKGAFAPQMSDCMWPNVAINVDLEFKRALLFHSGIQLLSLVD